MGLTAPGSALVTGAARRIGRAIARDLAAHGWHVAVHHHTARDQARELVAEIEAGGTRAIDLQADLANETDRDRWPGRACRRAAWTDHAAGQQCCDLRA
jgi:NAD(P)-dependent dehydrogenase (short-subunit alcohol dehydrogenase family)